MCPNATRPSLGVAVLVALVAVLSLPPVASAQSPDGELRPEWRPVGNHLVDLALPSAAGGPVSRVWYGGGGLAAETAAGKRFLTKDFEVWTATDIPVPPEPSSLPFTGIRSPEEGVRLRAAGPARLYAFGRHVYRSDDGGLNWTNLTAFRGESILGGGLTGLAVSPANPDEVVVASRSGLWRTVDGGLTWSGLNQGLPNLAVRRLLALPQGTRGARIWVENGPGAEMELEWNPGERLGWRPLEGAAQIDQERRLKEALGPGVGAAVRAVAVSGSWVYAGTQEGALSVSFDGGSSWLPTLAPVLNAGPAEGFWIDPAEPRTALAAMGARGDGARHGHVFRTLDGGRSWDNLTADLPEMAVYAVAADRATGAIYAACEQGLFLTYGSLAAAAPATPWMKLGGGLPDGPVRDVRLDEGANQVFVAVEGYGVFAAPAPHRARDWRIVNAADFRARAAAPGGLLSVLGAHLRAARAGNLSVPVLAASPLESQIQVPFEAAGTSLVLSLEGAAGRVTMPVPMETVSPAIFTDRDGSPMVLDGETGVVLDAMTPARSNGRLQILATGLGKVQPDWPTGLAAPLENPPRVAAPVNVFLDRLPLTVTRATLAPGYIGFYLLEVEMPRIVNEGPAELYLASGARESNRVKIYIAP